MTSLKVTPKSEQSFSEFEWVRSVVPKPGIVTAQISESGRFNNFIARTATSSAKVLSSPARNAYDRGFGAGVLKALFKPVGLYAQNRLGAGA